MPARDVRVVLVGDESVGKSSLISSLIKESFVKLHPRTTLPEVTIPPQASPGNDSVTTIIIDTSSRIEDRLHLENEIRKAHVVGIVFAVDNPNSFDRIPTYWLPTIRSLGVNVPVILIGNKIDLRSGQVTSQALVNEIVPIMVEFKEVETCVECSAKIPLNVSEVFYFAQNAVLHPTAPLYDTREHTLKPACVAALSRIFKLCDVNKDGILSDSELNEFQRQCFAAPLQSEELTGIKEIVFAAALEEPGIIEGGLTEAGFLWLQTYFIQKGRLETTWKVLRWFGYGDDLMLREGFLYPRFDVPSDCTVELSSMGNQFFTDIFERFDKDRDGALNKTELASLFSTSPGNPWIASGFPDTTITSDSTGAVTLQGWLAQWSMTTLLEPKVTLAYLAYLGYTHASSSSTILPTTSALSITRPRKLDRKKGSMSRSVFLAYVVGATGSGKTELLRNFIGRRFQGVYESTGKVKTVVNAVEIGGEEKYLVLQEFGPSHHARMLGSQSRKPDVLVLVYDSSDTNSFSFISNLRQQHKLDDIPTIMIASKSDLDLAQQRHEVQPETYCRKLQLQVPLALSIKTGQTADVFSTITAIAMRPSSSIPGGVPQPSNISYYLYISSAIIGALGVGVVVWKNWGKGGWFRD